jgi:hypothetical protein
VDAVFDALRAEFGEMVIERLVGTYPADDDNVYWLTIGQPPRFNGWPKVQIDTYPGGHPPFLLEGERDDGERVDADDPEQARAVLSAWLRRRTPQAS